MQFLYNAPAIFYKDALIVGDTHFGIERKMKSRGIHYKFFSLKIAEKLIDLIKEKKAKKLIILGDVKEEIGTMDETTHDALERLSEHAKLILVKGNHDGGLEFPGAEIVDSAGFVYKKIGLSHGHAWPAEELFSADYIINAHQHPLILFRDKLGKSHTEPAWLFAPSEHENIAANYENFNRNIQLVIIPAFNPLVGAVINRKGEKHLGPLLNNNLFKLEQSKVFRLDGTLLGKLGDIEV